MSEPVSETPSPVTWEQIRQVVNDAADRVIEQMQWGNGTPEQDAINLMVNVLGTMMDYPDVTVDEVMDMNYADGAAEVRSRWPGWDEPVST